MGFALLRPLGRYSPEGSVEVDLIGVERTLVLVLVGWQRPAHRVDRIAVHA